VAPASSRGHAHAITDMRQLSSAFCSPVCVRCPWAIFRCVTHPPPSQPNSAAPAAYGKNPGHTPTRSALPRRRSRQPG
jgi:hypothetical protein